MTTDTTPETISIEKIGLEARNASFVLNSASNELKNKALQAIRDHLDENKGEIQAANRLDKNQAEKAVKGGTLSNALSARLDCSGAKFDAMLRCVTEVMELDDPIGLCTLGSKISDRMFLYRVTVPVGVLAVIFEARPEAAVQIASLAIKSGNAAILKGGKEASNTNRAIFTAIQKGLKEVEGIPNSSVQFVETRDEVSGLLALDRYIDLVIPRGSAELVKSIKDNTRIPVMGHADGLCATYVDNEADLDMAAAVVDDSKTQYCAACNALETLLVHKDVAATFLPKLAERLSSKGVKYRADPASLPFLPAAETTPVDPSADFDMEFLSLVMAVKVVANVNEAIQHINEHGSHHTDVIVTKNNETAKQFMTRVDSAGVYHNCSSRFADGNRYGFGAEVGISTNRIHARGPVGLEGLVIHKYRLYGDGHTVEAFNKSKQATTGDKQPAKKAPAEYEYIHQRIPLASIPNIEKIDQRHSCQKELGGDFL
eukprot:Selendium_serpulae@DN5806_c0_g2_i2.p1